MNDLAEITLRMLKACNGDIEKAKPVLEAMGRADAIVEIATQGKRTFNEMMSCTAKYIVARDLSLASELTGLDEYAVGMIYGHGFGFEVGKAFAK